MSSTNESELQLAIDRLFTRTVHGIKPEIKVIRALLERMGNPESAFPSIHVAGTNGKGTVCAMLESILRSAGLKTGLYTSPHLVDFNERIRVSGRCISDTDLIELIYSTSSIADELAGKGKTRQATFFELSTAMAFEHFRRKQVDIAIIETGMGGLWDATNVIDPLLSVITGINIDHTRFLGNDILSIAREKAGIIKPLKPVVCGSLSEEVAGVIQLEADSRKSPVIIASDSISVSRSGHGRDGQKIHIEGQNASYGSINLGFIGDFQLNNCALAVAAIEALGSVYSAEIDAKAVKDGLSSCRWPARCQIIENDPLVILDSAHNPNGADALAEVLHTIVPNAKVGMIVGFVYDKDAVGFMRRLAGTISRCWVVPVDNERAMSVEEMESACRTAGVCPNVGLMDQVWNDAVNWAGEDDGILCIAGSIYLAGSVLRRKWGPGGLCRWFAGE